MPGNQPGHLVLDLRDHGQRLVRLWGPAWITDPFSEVQTDAGPTADTHYASRSEGQSASATLDGSRINVEQAERFAIRVGPKGIEDVLTDSAVIVDSIPLPVLDHIRLLSSDTFSEPWGARFAAAVATIHSLPKERPSSFRPSDQFLHTAQNYEVQVGMGFTSGLMATRSKAKVPFSILSRHT